MIVGHALHESTAAQNKSIKRTAEAREASAQRRHRSDAMAQDTLYRYQILIDKDEQPPAGRQEQTLLGNWKGFRSNHIDQKYGYDRLHHPDVNVEPRFHSLYVHARKN